MRADDRTIRRLLIVAECEHARRGASVACPGHFGVEIDEWASYVESVRLLTNFPPIGNVPPGWREYQSGNIEVAEAQGAFSGGYVERFRSLARSARTASRIAAGFRWADAVHVRGPCRNALLALLVARVIHRPLYFKWAGQWGGNKRWGLAARLQRRFLMRRGRETAVTVYELRQDDPSWIFVVDTSSLTEEQIRRTLEIPRLEPGDGCVELLWVGRFSANKNVNLLLRMLKLFRDQGWEKMILHLVGDGPLRPALEAESRELGIAGAVVFHGALGWHELARRYASARVLLLPSETEGFPKVVHEALLLGTPVVASSVGAIPRMLRGRGLAVTRSEGLEGFVRAIERVVSRRELWEEYSRNGRLWAASISIEKVVARHVATCEQRWGRRFSTCSPTGAGVQPWVRVES